MASKAILQNAPSMSKKTKLKQEYFPYDNISGCVVMDVGQKSKVNLVSCLNPVNNGIIIYSHTKEFGQDETCEYRKIFIISINKHKHKNLKLLAIE